MSVALVAMQATLCWSNFTISPTSLEVKLRVARSLSKSTKLTLLIELLPSRAAVLTRLGCVLIT